MRVVGGGGGRVAVGDGGGGGGVGVSAVDVGVFLDVFGFRESSAQEGENRRHHSPFR